MTLIPTKTEESISQAPLSHSQTNRRQSHPIPILSNKVVNVASVPQRSPLRYPGGKTWLVPQIRKWLAKLDPRPELFIEPFAGGGIASLTAVMDGYVDRALLCDRDPELSNLWRCILNDTDRLAQQVESFSPTPDNVRAVFDDDNTSDFESAFRTLLRNRVNRGGIIAKGASTMNKGENGNGLASRWYAKTLATRIRTIGSYAKHFEYVRGDGIDLVERYQDRQSAVFFIDPPYTAAGKRAGKRLYTFNEIDHESLFERVSAVKAPFMMTYDENDEVIDMALRRGFHLSRVAMKNSHHTVMYELLITSQKLSP
ncbi:MAG: DNA adenine methylase [Pseudomonadales bacterium]|nr:DNA adenine methylase [Pseudomonadales bacterium]